VALTARAFSLAGVCHIARVDGHDSTCIDVIFAHGAGGLSTQPLVEARPTIQVATPAHDAITLPQEWPQQRLLVGDSTRTDSM
jgi:hypothetical protein